MRTLFKLGVIVVIALLLGGSAYIIFFTGESNDDNGENPDTTPPTIDSVTGDTTGTAGKITTISATFSDNIGVTEAILYYKSAGASSWSSTSILNGTAHISIPLDSTGNWYYYVTVNDAAGNGPIGQPSVDGTSFYTIIITDDGGEENFAHTVFVEEATATWCNNCPNVANILHTIYETRNYQFYYISLVDDKNTKAHERLSNDYNIIGFPTVFIDGGYRVIVGGNKPESDYSTAIAAAEARTVPNIHIKVTTQYKNTTGELTVTAVVENNENQSYSGRLKIYLTEIVSGWIGYDSKPYQFAFLDYILSQDISVEGKGKKTVTEIKDISAYDYENLMVIGVVFSSEKQAGYANPPGENPFDAYYADATNATKVVEGGNLPPQVQITFPEKGKIYRNEKLGFLQKFGDRDRKLKFLENVTIIKNLMHNKTFILGFGEITIAVNANDDSAVAKVEFYIDGTLYYNDTEAPYEWTFKRISTKLLPSLFLKEHTLEVIVYDDTGKTSSSSLTFKARI